MPDSTEYGWVFTTSDTKDNLYNNNRDYYGNRTWENLYGQATIDAQASLDAAQLKYQDDLIDAYTTARQSKLALEQTTLYGEAKEAQRMDIDAAMQSAYTTYQNNLLAQEQTINQRYQQNLTAIDEALTKQAENYNALAGSAYEYLQYLFDEYDTSGDDENNIFANNDLWSRYTVTDEDGVRRLKSWQELVNTGANDVNGEYIGLFDEQRNLTIKGSEFFDQMFNEISVIGSGEKYKYGKGYWEWLNETNPELKAWAEATNPYDYTTAGTNIGSFKQDVGLLSTDDTYRFMERFGGFTTEEAKAMYADFSEIVSDLQNIASSEKSKNKPQEIIKSVSELTDKLQEYCKQLGINIPEDKWTSIKQDLSVYASNTKSMSRMASDWFKHFIGWPTSLSDMNDTSGNAFDKTVRWLSGAIIGGSINVNERRMTNKQSAQNAVNALNELLIYITKYSEEQHTLTNDNYKSVRYVK